MGFTAAVGASTLLTPRYAFAAAGPAYTGDTLVVVSLRGGADWLSLVPPFGDPNYAPNRPVTAIPTSAPALNSFFGLHPAMSQLLPLYKANQLAVVHAVGNPDPTRSHFDAIRLQELAGATSSGWLERTSASIESAAPGSGGALAAVHLGGANPPLSQSGSAPPTAMTALKAFTLTAPSEGSPIASKTLRTLYSGSKNPAGDAARDVLGSLSTVARAASLPPAATYPNTHTAQTLADVARLIKAQVGLQIVTLDVGGWDMHTNLGKAGTGQMAARAAELAGAIAAFAADLGPLIGKVTLVTLTEFGRRVAENGNAGLDHGHGYGMLVLGGAVNGGQVFATWPGLAPADLDQGDLAATLDFRQVVGEVLSTRCGIDPTRVFPGLPSQTVGIVHA